MRCALLLLVVLCSADHFAQQKGDLPEANPGRPTVSTPATLTPVGYLQFETGLFGAADSPDFSSRVNANEVVKLTVHRKLQLLLASEPVAYASEKIGQTKFGDAFVGFQAVVAGGEGLKPTFSASFFHKLREAGLPEVDFGSPRNSVVLLLSGDLGGFHFDANALANELEEGSSRRSQFGQTLCGSHRLKKFTISGEIWHFTQPFLHGRAIGNLWGIAYPIRKNLVVDAGFNHGLTSTSTQWEASLGFTYLLPHRLW